MNLDFRSDTVTQPTREMREAMLKAPLGDDVFGDDPSVNALQEQAADMLGFEGALFAASGTQTNLMAMMAHCQRGEEVILGQMAHTYRWEGGGAAVLASIQPQPLDNAADGTIPLAAIAAAIKPDDAHFARTRLIALENTIGGKVLPRGYVPQVQELARLHGLQLHLDGARLMNAAAFEAQGSSVAASAQALAAGFDSVSLCLSKGLGAPVGSLLLGSRDFLKRAHRVRKMLGGGMRQAGVLAAAGAYALSHHLERLHEDHANLQRLSSGLALLAADHAPLKGKLLVHPAQTNILFTDVAQEIAPHFAAHLAASGIKLTSSAYGASSRLRWVTHLDLSREAIDAALARIARFEL